MSRIKIDPLPPNRLRHACDLNTFTFKTTEELKPFEGLIGQERDIEALNLGSSIEGAGFNIFVLCEAGYGQRSVVRSVLQQKVQKTKRLKIGSMSTILTIRIDRKRSNCHQDEAQNFAMRSQHLSRN